MLLIIVHVLATVYVAAFIFYEWDDYFFFVHEDRREIVWPVLTTVVLIYVVILSWIPPCLL